MEKLTEQRGDPSDQAATFGRGGIVALEQHLEEGRLTVGRIAEVRQLILGDSGQQSGHFAALARRGYVLFGTVAQDDDASGHQGEHQQRRQRHQIHQVLQVEETSTDGCHPTTSI